MLFRSGKDQKGRLPVVISNVTETIASNQMRITFGSGGDLEVIGDLGEHFITWEWATALLGVALKVDPFNQPNVTEAKNATSELLTEWNNKLPELPATQKTNTVLAELLSKVDGYIAILAYLDRKEDVALLELRKILAEKSGKPVTFGWGPRFQHSTGQFHKAGQPNGAFLIITADAKEDFQIEGKEFTFQTLVMAQALGEYRALGARKYPVARLHISGDSRDASISEILAAAKAL